MKTILMVDDEEKIREVVVSYLQKDGFHTVEAETGRYHADKTRCQPYGFSVFFRKIIHSTIAIFTMMATQLYGF